MMGDLSQGDAPVALDIAAKYIRVRRSHRLVKISGCENLGWLLSDGILEMVITISCPSDSGTD
jgi:hypothetical protein